MDIGLVEKLSYERLRYASFGETVEDVPDLEGSEQSSRISLRNRQVSFSENDSVVAAVGGHSSHGVGIVFSGHCHHSQLRTGLQAGGRLATDVPIDNHGYRRAGSEVLIEFADHPRSSVVPSHDQNVFGPLGRMKS